MTRLPTTDYRLQSERGAALIISVLILATILLGLAVLGSIRSSYETVNLTATQNKKAAEALAVACMEHAMDTLGRNENYGGNEVVTIGSRTCTVRPIIVGANTWTIETQASVSIQWARYRAVLTSRAPVVIDSWEEVASF